MTSPRPLTYELEALQQVLIRLMTEETNLESLCKHVPRVTSVYANVARIQAGLEANKPSEAMDELLKALTELHEETNDGDQAFAW